MNYKYTVSAFVKQPKWDRIEFEEKTEIYGIHIMPQNEDQIKFLIELEGDNDQQVLEVAKRRMESIVYALTLTFDLPFMLSEPKIESKSVLNGRIVEITLFEYATLVDSIKLVIKPGAQRLAEVSALAARLDCLQPDRREALSRSLKWFYRAMEDQDQVDRFIQLYIALEVAGSFKYPKEGFTSRVKKILADYLSNSGLAEKIVKTRGALFHGGIKEDEVEQYNPYMTEALLKSMKEIAGLK